MSEICDKLVDDDGDGQVDCGDAECAGTAACASGTCSPGWTVSCEAGDTWSNDGFGSTQQMERYDCPGGALSNETGREYAYTYDAAVDGEVAVTASGFAAAVLLARRSLACARQAPRTRRSLQPTPSWDADPPRRPRPSTGRSCNVASVTSGSS